MTRSLPNPVCLDDYEKLAERVLDSNAWAYFAGGAGDELTMRWNRQAFERWAIVPNVLRRSEAPSTRIELLGRSLAHPIIVAPVAYQKMAHADGEIGTARAAAAQDSLMILSMLATTTIESASAEGPTCRWFQLYLHPRREDTLRLVRRAEASGYEAIVLTVDAPLSGVRNREQRASFKLPEGLRAINLDGIEQKAAQPIRDGSSAVVQEFLRVAPAWLDVEWLVSCTQLPIVIKGIASPSDARIAIESGAKAVIVSNHGGRTLDTIPASLDLLPAVAEAVGAEIPVLMDGGIRRGTDVIKCLALGARAVLVGRPVAFGLAASGAFGASHVLRLLRDEFEIAMLLSGCMSPADISRSLLKRSM